MLGYAADFRLTAHHFVTATCVFSEPKSDYRAGAQESREDAEEEDGMGVAVDRRPPLQFPQQRVNVKDSYL